MKELLLSILLVTLAVAYDNVKLTPHTLLEFAFKGNAEPMVLASPSWESFSEIPCQFFYAEGFYNLVDVWNVNAPLLLNSTALDPLQSDNTVYFNFCQKLSLANDFLNLGCDPAIYGDYFAIAVSPTQTCYPLSTYDLSSITNTTWNNGTSDLLAVQYMDVDLNP